MNKASTQFIALLLISFSSVYLNAKALDVENFQKAVETIDKHVAAGLKKNKLTRYDEADDYTFVRRIYLDVIGRIPSYYELQEFIDNNDKNKRKDLIDQLLNSEGYVSHSYNYWEDVLRVQSRVNKANLVGYQDWLKNQIRTNTPYDVFVRELITAEGYTWEDPAVGYYLRDAGMPLDNMANTAQVFLGTRMQCAQCHDHPTENWTQMQFYEMAAFTSDVNSASGKFKNVPELREFRKRVARSYKAKGETHKQKNQDRKRYIKKTFSGAPAQRRAIREIFEPLSVRVREESSDLKLPHDYQYDNGKPDQVIQAATPFGPPAPLLRNASKRESYAHWLTSGENLKFTTVIANRLWKRAMGRGIVEPVDDFTDKSQASNPELLTYLSGLLKANSYDIKETLRVIFNTRSYQSLSHSEDIVAGSNYLFPGPVMRRMSAEQLWDSILTLAINDLDSKNEGDRRTQTLRQIESQEKAHVKRVKNISFNKMKKLIVKSEQTQRDLVVQEKQLQQKIKQASNQAEKQRYRTEYRKLRAESRMEVKNILAELSGDEPMSNDQAPHQIKNKKSMNLVRASNIASPSPKGHFLHQFGESDRELIESSHQEAAIPQALNLLNSNIVAFVSKRDSPLNNVVKQHKGQRRKLDAIYLSIFSRKPTKDEYEVILSSGLKSKRKMFVRNISLALINSNEFKFIQ